MKAYKGFDVDDTCRGFKYEEGKTYHVDEARICESGFHACKRPLDCFDYYAPADSVYREVEIEDVCDSGFEQEDTKICGKTIKIGPRLSFEQLARKQIDYVKTEFLNSDADEPETLQCIAWDRSAATSDANFNFGRTVVAGNNSVALAKFNGGVAAVGERGIAICHEKGVSVAGKYGVALAKKGGIAVAGSEGEASSGFYGAAVSGKTASVGPCGLAVAFGRDCKVKGGIGACLVIGERLLSGEAVCAIKIVDGDNIKADTWYVLANGKFVEAVEYDDGE